MSNRLLILAAAVLSLGCNTEEWGPGVGPTVPPPGPVVPNPQFIPIAIADNSFNPVDIPVRVGVTVRFTNNGSQAHSVAFTTTLAGSGSIAPGAIWQVSFASAGTFPYKCAFHDGMTGRLVVNN